MFEITNIMEYWKKLSGKYIEDVGNKTDEEISESKFRELVRFEMEENFEKRKRDLRNKYKSQLAELENPKMDKRDKTEEKERLKMILKVIEEL